MPSSASIGERVLFSIAVLGLLTSIIVAFILGGLLEYAANYQYSKSAVHSVTFKPCQRDYDELVRFQSFMTSVVLNELDSYKTGELENSSSTAAIFKWSSPAQSRYHGLVSRFHTFLPPTWPVMQVGDEWFIIPQGNEETNDHTLLSKTHYPPSPVTRNEMLIHELLSVLHPRPFLSTRSLPRGSVAVVRALNEEWVHVAFRIHAEFQLNEPPLLPFWFTPSQFLGELVISRNSCSIQNFQMHVPNKRKLNVDLEWFKESDDQMSVEIGYLPQLELKLVCLPDAPFCNDGSNIKWETEISLDDAYDKMRRKMFRYQEVVYYPINEAFDRAKLENKLVHSVVLWGALDDHSC